MLDMYRSEWRRSRRRWTAKRGEQGEKKIIFGNMVQFRPGLGCSGRSAKVVCAEGGEKRQIWFTRPVPLENKQHNINLRAVLDQDRNMLPGVADILAKKSGHYRPNGMTGQE